MNALRDDYEMNFLATRAGILRRAGKSMLRVTDYGFVVTIYKQDSYFIGMRGTRDTIGYFDMIHV